MQDNKFYVVNVVLQIKSMIKNLNLKIEIPKRQPYHYQNLNQKIFLTVLTCQLEPVTLTLTLNNATSQQIQQLLLGEITKLYTTNNVSIVRQYSIQKFAVIRAQYWISMNGDIVTNHYEALTDALQKQAFTQGIQDFVRSEEEFKAKWAKILELQEQQKNNQAKQRQKLEAIEKRRQQQRILKESNMKYFWIKLLVLFAVGFGLCHLILSQSRQRKSRKKKHRKQK